MSQNLEIEFKNIITKQEFEKLKNYFQLNNDLFFTQENHYFDTSEFALKQRGCALRIRLKDFKYELTLKQPYQDGLLETNEWIDPASVEKMFQTGEIINKPIRSLIEKMNIDPSHIQYFGSLTTNRAEREYENGLIVLDHSYYLNIEDFEIEYEVSNRQEGQSTFFTLLKQLNIPIRETDNKIKRFYNEKYNQQTHF
ncbi:CYTH domain-containing protein [Cytobacillus dafuensis]|uniref:CYTH domain-containing protein n=1 Tax=Cytobacillus dafuensis TaxID=1742359 RepID=A0A5B8Z336_CYTDA|nr:CYTH domain-containing protein [Cytobacillus dafuensis]QED47247.1 CYTH domain-containing protein [Cytobacillus dafuensis]